MSAAQEIDKLIGELERGSGLELARAEIWEDDKESAYLAILNFSRGGDTLITHSFHFVPCGGGEWAILEQREFIGKGEPMVGEVDRFTKERCCPICGGHPYLPRGQGRRCAGYFLSDGTACVCMRVADGGKEIVTAAGIGYVHQLTVKNSWIDASTGKPVRTSRTLPESMKPEASPQAVQLETFLMPQVKETLLTSLRKPEVTISSGFEAFDDKLGGIRELVVLLGEPKIGKSTFALQVAVSAAKEGIGVLYFDTENGCVNLAKRIVSSTYEIGEKEITEEDAIVWDIVQLGNLAIIDDRRMMMGAGITSLVDKIRTRAPGRVLCVFDSLQKLPHDLGDRRAGIDYWLRYFEQLKKQEVGILLVSEVNRAGYNRQLGIQAGKESGDIEYSADVLLRLSPKGKRTSLYSLEVVTSRYHEHGVVAIYGLTKFRKFIENPDKSFSGIRFGSEGRSIEDFVRAYFKEQPEERLYYSEIASETDSTESAVGKTVAKMQDVKIATDGESRRRYVVLQ
jgi:KaiC/GvpD/RAD55 family RecA-like ATPase